jgi:hypothetical protein
LRKIEREKQQDSQSCASPPMLDPFYNTDNTEREINDNNNNTEMKETEKTQDNLYMSLFKDSMYYVDEASNDVEMENLNNYLNHGEKKE